MKGPSPCAKRLNRGETLKHHFQTDAVASSWLNQSGDDRKTKTRPRNKHQIIRQIRVDDRSKSIHDIQRGERDVTRLRNPTEDKRAFRRMLTSADRRMLTSTDRPGEECVINRARHLCNPLFSWREIVQEMASRSNTCLLQLLHYIRIL